MYRQLAFRGRALGRGYCLVDVGEVAPGKRRIPCRWAGGRSFAEPLDHDVDDLGGHDTIRRQLAARNAHDPATALCDRVFPGSITRISLGCRPGDERPNTSPGTDDVLSRKPSRGEEAVGSRE